jgi:hypothetical protein
MVKNFRKNARFGKIGRITAHSICVFQGIILDISLEGCRVRFPAVLNPDPEKDYEIVLNFLERTAPESLVLLGHIQWIESDADSTEIGFKLYHSPDSKKLASYIEKLTQEQQESLCPSL